MVQVIASGQHPNPQQYILIVENGLIADLICISWIMSETEILKGFFSPWNCLLWGFPLYSTDLWIFLIHSFSDYILSMWLALFCCCCCSTVLGASKTINRVQVPWQREDINTKQVNRPQLSGRAMQRTRAGRVDQEWIGEVGLCCLKQAFRGLPSDEVT